MAALARMLGELPEGAGELPALPPGDSRGYLLHTGGTLRFYQDRAGTIDPAADGALSAKVRWMLVR